MFASYPSHIVGDIDRDIVIDYGPQVGTAAYIRSMILAGGSVIYIDTGRHRLKEFDPKSIRVGSFRIETAGDLAPHPVTCTVFTKFGQKT
jgi:hypothetical protein